MACNSFIFIKLYLFMNTRCIRISILLLLLCTCVRSVAQNQLTGRIYNNANNTPIAFANIYIEDLRVGAISDSEGAFIIKNLPRGTYLVSVQYLGYATKNKLLKINGSINMDFPLSRTSFQKDEVVITG